MFAHGARVVPDRGRDDVDAGRVGIEFGGVEIGRERHDIAHVLRGRHHLEPLVGRDRDDRVVDQVLARSEHRLSVCRERPVEGRGMVRLELVDDLRFLRVRIDLAGCRGPRGLLFRELLPADLQDLVSIEAVEASQADQFVVGLAAQRPVFHRGRERPFEPRFVVDQSRPRRRCGILETPLVRFAQYTPTGRHDLVEQAGHVTCGLEPELLPESHLGNRRPRPMLRQEGRQCLEAGGHGDEALGQRREVASEQQEEGIAGGVERRGATLPKPDDVGIE